MKATIILKLSSFFICLLISGFSIAQPYYALSGNLSGANEVPANGSAAAGAFTGTYNAANNEIQIIATFSNLGSIVTAAHIHRGPAGMAGPVIIPLTVQGVTSGTVTGGGVLSESDEDLLLLGGLYVNVHSMGFPAGEIRGQIMATEAVPTLGTWSLIILGILLMCIGIVYIRQRQFHPLVKL